jgi:ubiquinone/menaquinone biosynthesis C-methylase UbiE
VADLGQFGKLTSAVSEGDSLAAPTRSVAVERIVPGKVEEALFREHEARYIFAGRFVKDKEVLDVACGTGIGTHYLLKAGAQRCIGLDIDSGAVDYARAAYKDCVFVQCDAISLCLNDSSVDVVVSFETIEHVRDQLRFLLECKRVLRPGGVLVCSTPNRTIYRWEGKNPFHLHEFTIVEFRNLIEAVFPEVRLHAQKNMVWLPYVTRRLLSRSLDRFRLKATVKKVFGWKPAPLAVRTQFGALEDDLDSEIQPYRATRLSQPMYVIAVGRKPFG